jgi:hypothetical protein
MRWGGWEGLRKQYDRGQRNGAAGRDEPPHGFWRALAEHLGLLSRRAGRRLRLDNNAYRAGQRQGKAGEDN